MRSVASAILGERKSAVLRAFESILENVLTGVSAREGASSSEIVEFVNLAVEKSMSTEREMFLSYLMHCIMHIQKGVARKMDIPILAEFEGTVKRMSEKYDSNQQLAKLLDAFASKKVATPIPGFSNFYRRFATFNVDVTKMRSVLYEARSAMHVCAIGIRKEIETAKEETKRYAQNAVDYAERVKRERFVEMRKAHEVDRKLWAAREGELEEMIAEANERVKAGEATKLQFEGEVLTLLQKINVFGDDGHVDMVAVAEVREQSRVMMKTMLALNDTRIMQLPQKKGKDDEVMKLKKEVERLKMVMVSPRRRQVDRLRRFEISGQCVVEIASVEEERNTVTDTNRAVVREKRESKHVMKSLEKENQSLRDEMENMRQKLRESNESVDSVSQENGRLSRRLVVLRERMTRGKAHFNSLYADLERLQEKLRCVKRNQPRQEERTEVSVHIPMQVQGMLFEELNECKTEMGQKEEVIEKLEKDMITHKGEIDFLQEAEYDARTHADNIQARFSLAADKGVKRERKLMALTEEVVTLKNALRSKIVAFDNLRFVHSDLKTRYKTLRARYAGIVSEHRAVTAKSRESEMDVMRLSQRAEELENITTRQEREISRLKDSTESMSGSQRERDSLEFQLQSVISDNAALGKMNDSVKQQISDLRESELRSREELMCMKRSQMQVQSEIDESKFRADLERTKLECEKQSAVSEKEELEQRVRTLENDRKSLLEKVQEARTEIEAEALTGERRVVEVTETMNRTIKSHLYEFGLREKELQARLDIALRESQEMRQQITELASQVSIRALEAVDARHSLTMMESAIRKVLECTERTDYLEKVQQLQSESRAKDMQIAGFKRTMEKCERKYPALFTGESVDRTNIESVLDNVSIHMSNLKSDRDLILTRVERVTDEINMSGLYVQTLEDVPKVVVRCVQNENRASENLGTVREEMGMLRDRHMQILSGIRESVAFTDDESIPEAVKKLVTELNNSKCEYDRKCTEVAQVMNNIRAVLPFSDDADLSRAVADVVEVEKGHILRIMELEEATVKLEEELVDQRMRVDEVLRDLMCDSVSEIPKTLRTLKERATSSDVKLSQAVQRHTDFAKDLVATLEINMSGTESREDVIARTISRMKRMSDETIEEMSHLKRQLESLDEARAVVKFDSVAELPQTMRRLLNAVSREKLIKEEATAELEKAKEAKNEFEIKLASVLSFSELSEVPAMIALILTQKEEIMANNQDLVNSRSSLISQLSEVLSRSTARPDESDILSGIEDLKRNCDMLRTESDEYCRKIENLIRITGCRDESKLSVFVNEMLNEHNVLKKRNIELVNDHQTLTKLGEELSSVLHFDSILDVPKQVRILMSSYRS